MKRNTTAALAGALALCTLVTVGSAHAVGMSRMATSAPSTPVLNTGVVLFVDSHRIGTTRNLRRNYIPGRKWQVDGLPEGQVRVSAVRRYRGVNPDDDALDGDTDIDSRYLLAASTVLREIVDGKPHYRMWLRSGTNVGYRESLDGRHWTIHDADSVIVARDVTGVSVMKDPKSGLYYLTGWSRLAGHYVEMVSADGITFRTTTGFSGVLSTLYGDVIQASGDPITRRLYAIAKQKTSKGTTCKASSYTRSGGRAFGTHMSSAPTTAGADDAPAGRNWVPSAQTVTADCVDALSVPPVAGTNRPAHLYGISFQRYGDQFLGFPWFFQVTKLPPTADQSGFTDGPVDTQIASTPDVMGVPWQRADANVPVGGRATRPALIPRGPEGSWDDGMIYGHAGLVNIEDRSVLFYTGWNATHLPTIGREARTGAVSWRHGRFVGLKVTDQRGYGKLRTRGFHLPATATNRSLYVNAALASSWLRASVVDYHTGRTIPGFGPKDSVIVRGDQMAAEVRWRGRKLGQLRSRAIRLVFTYGAGSLYSFRVS